MLIERNTRKYFVFSGDKIINALQCINDNKSRIVFVVEHNGLFLGSLSDGDIRRWITGQRQFDLNCPVDEIMHREAVSFHVNTEPRKIEQAFSHKIDTIPLLDDAGRFVGVARKNIGGLKLGDHLIDSRSPCFVIAEIGNNHQGELDLAKKLVDEAAEAGADCVKFQMRDLTHLYANQGQDNDASLDLGTQYTVGLLNKYQLSSEEMFRLFDYSRERGILPLCTPWDVPSFEALEAYGMDGYKIASADFTNHELLRRVAVTGKPMICSTGMCKEWEIRGSVNFLKELGAQFAVLHCNSTYPTPFKDVNLHYIKRLKEISGCLVGYSGHERGYTIPLAAVAMGAKIVEKHLTLDRELEGNDHKVSLLPGEFREMVTGIREIETAMGSDEHRQLSQGELINRENLAKSLVINCSLDKGETITREMISVKSPGQGLQPNRMDELVGRRTNRDLAPGDVLFESDLKAPVLKKTVYEFSHPYGIPVRYHDYAAITRDIELDFVEFHLSFQDMEIEPETVFDGPQSLGFAVHCPELFKGDHLLDLSNADPDYRRDSMDQLGRVIEITKKLKNYFPATPDPVIIVNAGGWCLEGFLPAAEKERLYRDTEIALAELDFTGVRLASQTMPPFPWHFGGQSHHNIFVDPDEIAAFCDRTGHGICLDVSHTMMACNYYQWDFEATLDKILPKTIHLHISDALGVDGEGVQTGGGDVDFQLLKRCLDRHGRRIPFIPEIWQGHKDKGKGFWEALAFFEQVGI